MEKARLMDKIARCGQAKQLLEKIAACSKSKGKRQSIRKMEMPKPASERARALYGL